MLQNHIKFQVFGITGSEDRRTLSQQGTMRLCAGDQLIAFVSKNGTGRHNFFFFFLNDREIKGQPEKKKKQTFFYFKKSSNGLKLSLRKQERHGDTRADP